MCFQMGLKYDFGDIPIFLIVAENHGLSKFINL